ncbi:MAG: LytTR family DNA-binding domain-containing protein [Oceanicaulis sp.]
MAGRTIMQHARGAMRSAALVVGVGTFLALIGPFGTHQIGWPQVWLYWVALIGFGALFGHGAGELLPRLFPKLPEWAVYVLAAAFLSVPVSVAVVGLEGAFGGGFDPTELLRTYPPVFVISGFVAAVIYAVTKLSERREAADRDAPLRPARALTDKLPHRLRTAPILSLTSEDHYLRVRTDLGEALILMRLSDAVAAMEGVDGAQTHRSWWVAREAVTDARKGDGRGTLILKDGAEAPVSRTYYPALREAGWF